MQSLFLEIRTIHALFAMLTTYFLSEVKKATILMIQQPPPIAPSSPQSLTTLHCAYGCQCRSHQLCWGRESEDRSQHGGKYVVTRCVRQVPWAIIAKDEVYLGLCRGKCFAERIDESGESHL